MGRLVTGAQTVDRTCGLLTDLGRHSPAGVRLFDRTAPLGLRPAIGLG